MNWRHHFPASTATCADGWLSRQTFAGRSLRWCRKILSNEELKQIYRQRTSTNRCSADAAPSENSTTPSLQIFPAFKTVAFSVPKQMGRPQVLNMFSNSVAA